MKKKVISQAVVPLDTIRAGDGVVLWRMRTCEHAVEAFHVSRSELSHRIDVRWPTLFADLTNECRQFFTELRVAIHKMRGE